MRCSRCEHENRDDALFCEGCGGRVEPGCASCGTANAAGANFCRKCGTPLRGSAAAAPRNPRAYTPKHLAEKILTSRAALEGERKQVTATGHAERIAKELS